MITADQLKDVLERADALEHYLNIDQKKVEFEEEQLRTQAPDFWEDPKRAEEQMKKVKTLERWIKGYENVRRLADELKLAFDFHKDELVTEEEVDTDYNNAIKAIEDLELMNMLRQKEDPMDCVLKINSGAGGSNRARHFLFIHLAIQFHLGERGHAKHLALWARWVHERTKQVEARWELQRLAYGPHELHGLGKELCMQISNATLVDGAVQAVDVGSELHAVLLYHV